ncbi:darcynin family protein [Actinokineospora enzanensis]|uniref:darcynin family protein n=1 Tax=Actinokineospora enzanensis TaxID=155975 RepID=UPI000373A85F|nr:darcynin family protein [Actinokineospora enzanensis]
MPADRTEAAVTAFMLVKTTPEWQAMTVADRVAAFTAQVVSVIEARARGVRSRFYDTEFYSARVTDIWVWEADDHDAYPHDPDDGARVIVRFIPDHAHCHG